VVLLVVVLVYTPIITLTHKLFLVEIGCDNIYLYKHLEQFKAKPVTIFYNSLIYLTNEEIGFRASLLSQQAWWAGSK
jgi:hypothetical protein